MLAEDSYEFAFVCLSVSSAVCLSVRSARSWKWFISFFLIFCAKLDRHKVRKVKKSDFWKKGSSQLGGYVKSNRWP